ncbi:hypothetical protein EPA93_40945 [Ktedonosporobacter rubrisoli]|uniref:Uncharacterized protein n=1 Tax=Ktedonosporobacter rubrisoli TaxID=2509675 RepID=A0A4P6K1N3_KTERU|nr:hypothetical protein [Ktedonosporobacter rubrisoli]QBD82009.1 hypothetical protein EPA93_40945 [Ktedonosporobacter rubrisoli]
MATTYQYIPSSGNEAKETRPGRIVYPQWPTSKPGPLVTQPPAGQRPVARRSDQMVYDCYDQELGRACQPPTRLAVREHEGKNSLPAESLRNIIAEAEAMQRWLDDGGAQDKDATSEVGEVLPLSFARS